MARYNREFLVPYLQTVCALQLAERKLRSRYGFLVQRETDLNNGKYNPEPKMPYEKSVLSGGGCFLFACGAFFIVLGVFGMRMMMSNYSKGYIDSLGFPFFMVFGLAVLGVSMIIGGYNSVKERKEDNAYELKKYYEAKDRYEKIKKSNEQGKANLPAVRAEMNTCTNEINRINTLLNRVYNANVIPYQYRNMYASVYLYDYFSGSREDDLALALNTFVLEQIKERLDVIIEQQSEMILNQRIMIAKQEKTIQLQQAHTAMMQNKLNQIVASNEERNQYLRMIEGNTAATAYFAAADYIRRI